MSSLDAALHRLIAENADPGDGPARLSAVFGTVASINGTALDGHPQVTVTVGSDTQPMPYSSTYSPAVGDRVLVLLVGPSPVILAHIIGAPNLGGS